MSINSRRHLDPNRNQMTVSQKVRKSKKLGASRNLILEYLHVNLLFIYIGTLEIFLYHKLKFQTIFFSYEQLYFLNYYWSILIQGFPIENKLKGKMYIVNKFYGYRNKLKKSTYACSYFQMTNKNGYKFIFVASPNVRKLLTFNLINKINNALLKYKYFQRQKNQKLNFLYP